MRGERTRSAVERPLQPVIRSPVHDRLPQPRVPDGRASRPNRCGVLFLHFVAKGHHAVAYAFTSTRCRAMSLSSPSKNEIPSPIRMGIIE